MFYKVTGSFILWYVLAQLTMAYMNSSSASLTLAFIFVGVSYFVFPLVAGAFIFNSSNK